MKTNLSHHAVLLTTHEGGRAARTSSIEELTRTVSSCLLMEDTFYERGSDIAARISELCDKVSLEEIGALAHSARFDLKLRHVPLWLAIQTVRLNSERKLGSDVPSQTIFNVVNRPDELSELLALYWKNGRRPIAKQLKQGLALAFTKFNEFQLAKWNRNEAIKLRDVLFLCRAKPETKEQALLWQRLIADNLEVPDTWEVALSKGENKRSTWERLLTENKLGSIALLMNLRNMDEAGVDRQLVCRSLLSQAAKSWALPFRYVTAAEHAPSFAQYLNLAMLSTPSSLKRLPGQTILVLDVSGSMLDAISSKSSLSRMKAGAALGVLLRACAEDCRIFTFSDSLAEVGNYLGLALISAVVNSQPHGGTYLAQALHEIKIRLGSSGDRLIVITDEQAHDGLPAPWTKHAYLVNVAPYKPALPTHGAWIRVSGWSERVVDWIFYEETGYMGPPPETL